MHAQSILCQYERPAGCLGLMAREQLSLSTARAYKAQFQTRAARFVSQGVEAMDCDSFGQHVSRLLCGFNASHAGFELPRTWMPV